jgi:hypothetical protein
MTGSGTLPKKLVSFFLQNTADTGTVLHRLMQQAWAEQGVIFGNWHCNKCARQVQLSMPLRCCGQTMEYRELHVEDPVTGFSGHSDALVPHADGLWLVDFKTKNPKKLKSITLTNPHRLQVSAYKYHLTRDPYNLKILGSTIVVLSREDKPDFRLINIEPDELADLEFERFRRQRLATLQAVTTGEVSTVTKLCSGPADQPYCPFHHRCFGPDQHNFLAYLRTEWEKSKSVQRMTTAD